MLSHPPFRNTSRLRAAAAAASLLVGGAACAEPLVPAPLGGSYVLALVDGHAVPASFALPSGLAYTFFWDTLHIPATGPGLRHLEVGQSSHGAPEASGFPERIPARWLRTADGLVLEEQFGCDLQAPCNPLRSPVTDLGVALRVTREPHTYVYRRVAP